MHYNNNDELTNESVNTNVSVNMCSVPVGVLNNLQWIVLWVYVCVMERRGLNVTECKCMFLGT